MNEDFELPEPSTDSSLERNWLRVTVEKTALDSLKKVAQFIEHLSEDEMNWKWVIISLFDSLYAFAVAALTGGNYDRVTRQTKGGKLRLITFDEAIKRSCSDKHMRLYGTSYTMILSASEKQSVCCLRSLRNDFIHFIPKLWFVEIEGLPEMSKNIIRLIKFLALESGNEIFLDDNQRAEVEGLVSESLTVLDSISRKD